MLLHVYLNATCTEFCEKMLMCDFDNKKKPPRLKYFVTPVSSLSFCVNFNVWRSIR